MLRWQMFLSDNTRNNSVRLRMHYLLAGQHYIVKHKKAINLNVREKSSDKKSFN